MSPVPKSATNFSISASFFAESDSALISTSALSSGVPAWIGTFFPICARAGSARTAHRVRAGSQMHRIVASAFFKVWGNLSPEEAARQAPPCNRKRAIEAGDERIDDCTVSMDDASPQKRFEEWKWTLDSKDVSRSSPRPARGWDALWRK